MRNVRLRCSRAVSWVAATALGLSLAIGAAAGEKYDYPKTRTVDQVDDFFGTKVADPYRWLEDVGSPEVEAWVEAQNALTRGYLDKVRMRPQIAQRLTELLDYPRVGLPKRRGPYYFFSMNSGLQNQSVYYKQRGAKGKPEVLLDPNAMAQDGTISVSNLSFTTDGKLAAYSLAQSGSDWVTIHVRDVETGKDLGERLERSRFTNLAWTADNKGFYYSRYPEPGSVPAGEEEHWQKLYYHRLGEPQSQDRLVYERQDDKDCGTSADVSEDGRWLVIHVWKGTAPENEVFVQRLGVPDARIEPLFTGFDWGYSFIASVGDQLYFQTNEDAPRDRVVAVDMANERRMREIVPQSADVLGSATLANGQLVLSYLHDAYSVLRTFDLAGKPLRDVEMPTLGSISGVSGRADDPELFVSFTSFLFPTQNYTYDFAAGKLVLFQEAAIDFDAAAYETKQVFYNSKDGTRIPMFLVHRKGLELNGDNPTILYGYGGFNQAMKPYFSTSRLFWFEQGGVLAVANLRGGSEYGEEWHKAGTLERKQNVFDDFIAAAEWLVAHKYTRPERLAIQGGSNGGLLTAACALQRPELYGAVLCQVPVTDMLRYHRFTIGSYWRPDYGDPDKPEHFKFLYAYSPVHNVKPGTALPAMFITTADTDTRVHPMHGKKFAAATQAANTSGNPILLRVETKAGHGAGKPTSKQIDEQADLYGFVMDRFGMSYSRPGEASARRGSH